MKKIYIMTGLIVATSFALGAFQSKALAQVSTRSKAFKIAAESQVSGGLSLMHVVVKDANPKAGVCPYFVKSMQYLEAVHILNIEIYQEICVNDAYGISQGEIFWVAPKTLQAKGQLVTVLINQTEVGALAFDESRQSFSVRGAE